MSKTFDEWYEEFEFALIDSAELNTGNPEDFNFKAFKMACRIVWEESRQNMTIRGI